LCVPHNFHFALSCGTRMDGPSSLRPSNLVCCGSCKIHLTKAPSEIKTKGLAATLAEKFAKL